MSQERKSTPKEPTPFWHGGPGLWANVLGIAAAIIAVLQWILTIFEFVSRPIAILATVLPFVVILALSLGIGFSIYTVLRPGSPRQRRLALFSLGILALAGAGWGGWQAYEATRPPKGIRILIADFDGSAASRRIAYDRQIYERVQAELVRLGLDDEVEMLRVFETFPDSETARAAGESEKATLVIWGWYDDAGVRPHFELPRTFERYQTSLSEVSYLENFDLNISGSAQEMAYVTTLVLGLIYYEERDYPNAASLFEAAIENAPAQTATVGLDVPYFYKANALFYQHRAVQEIVTTLKKAVEINPELWGAHANLALAYKEYCDPYRRLDLALEEAQIAQSLKPSDPYSYQLLGEIYSALGQGEEAAQSYEEALVLDPESLDGHRWLAEVYQNLGREEEAAAQFALAEKLSQEKLASEAADPSAIHLGLGHLYYSQARYEEALAEYQETVKLLPQDVDLHLNLGIVYLFLERIPEAMAELERARELAPHYYSVHEWLGWAWQEQGELEKAIAEYEEALRLQPCSAYAHQNLAGIYFNQEGFHQAISHYQKAIEIDPQDVDSHYFLGVALYLDGQYPEAEDAFLEALARDPNYADAHYLLGLIYDERGEYEAAARELQEATRLNPQDAEAYARIGLVYFSMGQLGEAAAALQNSLSLDPTNPFTHYDLGLVLESLGDVQGAITAFESAIFYGGDQEEIRALAEAALARLGEE